MAALALTAPAAIELYARAFDEVGALDKLEAFASLNGPRFFMASALMPIKSRSGVNPRQLPEAYPYAGGKTIVPLLAGESLEWSIKA